MVWDRKRKMRVLYDASSRAYDKAYAQEQEEKYNAALRLAHIKEEDTVLDLGCGPGHLLEQLATKTGFAVGVDLSAGLLRIADTKIAKQHNASLICCDAENLPFKNNAFQKVFVITVLQNLVSPRQCLREIHRVMSPKGTAVISFLKIKTTKTDVNELLKREGFQTSCPIDEGNLKDFIALCEHTRRQPITSK